MRKIIYGLLVISLAGNMACNKKSSSKGDKIYDVETAIVHYQTVDMQGMKMTRTAYISDYGRKESQEVLTEGVMPGTGQTVKVRQVDIRDGNVVYSFQLEHSMMGKDSVRKEAVKMNIPAEEMNQLNLFSEANKKKFSYKEEGTEMIAGLKGTKFSLAPDSTNPASRITAVHYKNIPVKFPMGPGMDFVAEKIELGVNIPGDRFKVPAGYKITDQSMPGMPGAKGQGK